MFPLAYWYYEILFSIFTPRPDVPTSNDERGESNVTTRERAGNAAVLYSTVPVFYR